MPALTSIGGLVLVVAVVVGSVGQFAPHLFLSVPYVGSLLHKLSGNPTPAFSDPLHDPTPFEEAHFRTWARDGDCIVATYPKSGTVWAITLVHLLKSGGNDEWEGSIWHQVGMPEFKDFPEHTVQERIHDIEERRARADKTYMPGQQMLHVSHRSPKSAPFGMNPRLHPSIKFIALARNGQECLRSAHNFFASFTPEFRSLWGLGPAQQNRTMSEDKMDRWMSIYFDWVEAWWEVQQEPNVLLLHYTDLKTDLEGAIRRVASFLEIELTTTQLERVSRFASSEHMKVKGRDLVSYQRLYGRPDARIQLLTVSHVGEGKADGAAESFTPSMKSHFDDLVRGRWENSTEMMRWAASGASGREGRTEEEGRKSGREGGREQEGVVEESEAQLQ